MQTATHTLRDQLKSATAQAHAALDAAAGRWRLDDADGYSAFLRAQAAALIPVEQALEHAGIELLLPDWATRARRAVLLSDLVALGAAAPVYIKQPHYRTPAEVWGAAYVLEGSRLGARFLLKQVEKAGGTLTLPTAFLAHGEKAGLWQSFVEKLENSEARNGREGAVRGARMTFTLFTESFGAAA